MAKTNRFATLKTDREHHKFLIYRVKYAGTREKLDKTKVDVRISLLDGGITFLRDIDAEAASKFMKELV